MTDFFARYGAPVERYGILLNELSTGNPSLREKLEEREADARALAGAEPFQPFAHTLALLRDLASDQDWVSLRAQSERLLDSPERTVAIEAQRMLALCLSQTTELSEKAKAIALYKELSSNESAVAADLAALASLLADAGNHEAAKEVVLDGMNRFPDAAEGFATIGQRIVEATGDRAFRNELSAQRVGRRTE